MLENEENNADYWLQPETKTKMLQIVEYELITNKAEEISNKDSSGVKHMFQQKNSEELKLMFDIFKRDSTTFRLIIHNMNPYILDRGS